MAGAKRVSAGPWSPRSCLGPHLMSTERIRVLNDRFRTTMNRSKVLMAADVDAPPAEVKAAVIQRVTTFLDFNVDAHTISAVNSLLMDGFVIVTLLEATR